MTELTPAHDLGSTPHSRSATTPRRVLMMCYYFPPLRSSGTTRSTEFAKRLPSFGWQPIILTVRRAKDRWSEGEEPVPPELAARRTTELDLHGLVDTLQGVASWIARLFHRNLQRNYFREYLCFPDPQIAWQTTLPGLMLARNVDVIYASCSPFSSALSASLIRRVTGRPLVLDFRDPWSLNMHHDDSGLRQAAIERAEAYALRHCDRLILNTEGAARLYRDKYPGAAAKFRAIPNGYDRLTPAPHRNAAVDSTFTIMHVGSFYGKRQPDRLLEALASIGDPRVQFVQVGTPFPRLQEFSSRLAVRVIPTVSRGEALRLMQTADLLYLAQGAIDGDVDVAVGAKTYEYLATGLPILAECPPGENADLVRRYCPEGHVISSGSVVDIALAVRRSIEARHRIGPAVHPEFVRLYSRDRLTQLLAGEFDELAGAPSAHPRKEVS